MTKVSVIIPAFQAENTLGATLRSVLVQTHRDIEVLVIDDGSTDATRMTAECIAALDRRVRVLGQANAGVAAARNLGIEHANGAFIAPLDADDIWHPRKLELQLARFAQNGPQLGLVYNWHRLIDADNCVFPPSSSPRVEGRCLHRHLAYNFIANGSTPLIRRTALGDLRYDPGLAHAGVGGCEDYLLQLQVAREWEFGLVPAWLTGYRKTGTSMSSDEGRMIRSHIATLRLMAAQTGRTDASVIARRIARLQVEAARGWLLRCEPTKAIRALGEAARLNPARLPRNLLEEVVARIRRSFPARSSDAFDIFAFDQPDGSWRYKLAGAMAKLARLDEELAGSGAG